MSKKNTSRLIMAIALIFPPLFVNASQNHNALSPSRSEWVGKYPGAWDQKENFADYPTVKGFLKKTFGAGKFLKIRNNYSRIPIKYVDGWFVLHYTTKGGPIEGDLFEWISVFVQEDTGTVAVADQYIGTPDRVEWYFSDMKNKPPEGALKLVDLKYPEKGVGPTNR